MGCNDNTSNKKIDEITTGKSIWWKETVFYEIYMPSFKDGNSDGLSDFKGMTQKLDYLQNLGIKGIWLTPFYQSPKVDNGYDISDYRQIDPQYGDLDDFKNFISEAHKRGIKVIVDMVLNHSSTHHKWFKEARKSKDNPYRDYYIWKDKPNNWESFFGGSAWQYDSITKQYYYHKFAVEMADLNWANPKVVEESKDILRYWMDLGVDGFRLDVINFLSTSNDFIDNPLKDGKQDHINDIDQKGIYKALAEIKKTISEREGRFIVGEIGSDKIDVLMKYQSDSLLDVVFNFNFGSIPKFDSKQIFDELVSMEENMKNFPTLFFGSHDMPRLISRLANDDIKKAKALAALMLTAKGVPFIYFGEEIGMQNIIAQSKDQIRDIQGVTHYELAKKEGLSDAEALTVANDHNRDKSRSTMQWDSSEYSGFSNTEPWIYLSENYKDNSVEVQANDPNSLLSFYKNLIQIRNSEKALMYGEYIELTYYKGLIKYTRKVESDSISIYINFGKDTNVSDNPNIILGELYNGLLKMNDVLIVKN